MNNKKYLFGIGLLMTGLFFVEQILGYLNITESYIFLVFWLIFFTWILFGKRFLSKRT
jgi:thiol:disulfide interchange protein